MAALWRPGVCWLLPGGPAVAPRKGVPGHRAARAGKMFARSPPSRKNAGTADTQAGPQDHQRSLPARIRRPVAGTTARRRLATPARNASRHSHRPRRGRQQFTSQSGTCVNHLDRLG